MSIRGSAFGLLIESDRRIPGLAAPHRGGSPDVRLELGHIPPAFLGSSPVAYRQPHELGRAELLVRSGGHGMLFEFEDGCRVAVDPAAGRVWAAWPPHLQLEDVAIYLLGPVLALVLRRRGHTVLHASAVARGGAAAALVGSAGAGKSTTAAALAGRGFAVVTDDVLALDPHADGVYALPGPPVLRLWEDASAALFGRPDALPLLTPNWEKRYLDVEGGQTPAPLPVRTLYLLSGREPSDAPRLEPTRGPAAVLALVGNTYHGWLGEPASRARDLAVCGALVRGARVRRLVPRDDPASLDDLAALIEHDLDRAD